MAPTDDLLTFAMIGLLVASLAGPANAEDLEQKVARMEKVLAQQQQQIAEHERLLAEQARTIARQQRQLAQEAIFADNMMLPLDGLAESRGTGSPAGSQQTDTSARDAIRVAQAPDEDRKPVGQAPPKQLRTPPKVQAIADVGGVLTPKGKLVIEPELQYSHSDVNRLTFRGIELLGSLGIGLLSADDTDRDALIASITGRYGLTNRMEVELKIPYVYRDDNLTDTIPQLPTTTTEPAVVERSLDGSGLGDIELALHYQLNSGLDGWPIFIANLRYKSVTGDGIFDVKFDSDGIATELATGSGFHSLEPSITALYPSDPAVFFANLGYLFNIEDDVDKIVGAVKIGDVDPGDAVRLSFGMAYSINERTSFTLGFKNDFIQKTKTEFIDPSSGVSSTQRSSTLNIGALLLGYSFQLNPQTSINLNLELGITDDAPDVLMTLRTPFLLDL